LRTSTLGAAVFYDGQAPRSTTSTSARAIPWAPERYQSPIGLVEVRGRLPAQPAARGKRYQIWFARPGSERPSGRFACPPQTWRDECRAGPTGSNAGDVASRASGRWGRPPGSPARPSPGSAPAARCPVPRAVPRMAPGRRGARPAARSPTAPGRGRGEDGKGCRRGIGAPSSSSRRAAAKTARAGSEARMLLPQPPSPGTEAEVAPPVATQHQSVDGALPP
jgi:hypothetical protein